MVDIVKYNEDNLEDSEIDIVVTTVKAIVISSALNILIGKDKKGYHLVEAKVGPKESLEAPLFQALFEETGIRLDGKDKFEPFYEVRYYCKNFANSGKNKLSDTIYFLIFTDKEPNLDIFNLTPRQLLERPKMQYVFRDDFEKTIEEYIENEKDEMNRIRNKEILVTFRKLKSVYQF